MLKVLSKMPGRLSGLAERVTRPEVRQVERASRGRIRRLARPGFQSFWFQRSGVGRENVFLFQFPGVADAARAAVKRRG